MTRTASAACIASAFVFLLGFAAVPALAGKGGPGGRCARNAPSVSVDNNWAWGASGSFGLPGQRLAYAIDVSNNDVGCSGSSFAVGVTAPGGFSVSLPTSAISLKSASAGYLWAYVTSPTAIADGDYPVSVRVARAGTSSPTGSFTSYYKVYSYDTVAPTLYWPDPWDGATISGSTHSMTVSSYDDHAVQKLELYVDGAYKSATQCDDIAYTCQLFYNWATSAGQHTATFRSYDWLGNVGSTTVTFTVA